MMNKFTIVLKLIKIESYVDSAELTFIPATDEDTPEEWPDDFYFTVPIEYAQSLKVGKLLNLTVESL